MSLVFYSALTGSIIDPLVFLSALIDQQRGNMASFLKLKTFVLMYMFCSIFLYAKVTFSFIVKLASHKVVLLVIKVME